MLLIEHDGDLAWTFMDLLRGRYAHLTHVANGDDALRLLSENSVDAVVLDLDGIDRPLEIVAAARSHRTVVLMGVASRRVLSAGDLGLRWVLEKPVEAETLLSALATAAPERSRRSG